MISTKYYLNEMANCKKKIEELKKEKANYDILSSKIKQLLFGLPDAKVNLIDAESSFKDGGFVDEDGPFDKGKLNESILILNSTIESINGIIGKINGKISSLDKEMDNYNHSYNISYANYRKALTSNMEVK